MTGASKSWLKYCRYSGTGRVVMNMADTGIAIGNNNEYFGNVKCSHEYGRHPLLITCVIVRVTASLGQWREGLNMTRDAVSGIPKKLFGVERLGKNVATNSRISCTVQHMFVLYLFTYMFIFKFLFMCMLRCSCIYHVHVNYLYLYMFVYNMFLFAFMFMKVFVFIYMFVYILVNMFVYEVHVWVYLQIKVYTVYSICSC